MNQHQLVSKLKASVTISLVVATIPACFPISPTHIPSTRDIFSFKVTSRPHHATASAAGHRECEVAIEIFNRGENTITFLDPICAGNTETFFHNGHLIDTSAAYTPIQKNATYLTNTICISPGETAIFGMPFGIIDGMLEYGPLAVVSIGPNSRINVVVQARYKVTGVQGIWGFKESIPIIRNGEFVALP